jgi:uroporphyrinogen-III decarboxylase
MIKEALSSRERILATLRQEDVDRFPVWLKMANSSWKLGQPEPWRSMEPEELLRAAGCDLMLGARVECDKTNPHVTTEIKSDPESVVTTYHTPDGILSGVIAIDPVTQSGHPAKYFIENADDLRMLRWIFTDSEYVVDPDDAADAKKRQKELAEKDAFTMSGIGPSPLMDLIENYCGLENAIYLQMDEPELFEEVIELMHQDHIRGLKARLPHEVADSFWMIENTSTTIISPGQFKKYCMPQLKIYSEMVLEHGIIPVHHMCGTLNALLELIDELPAVANEAFTTAPVGDVSLQAGRERMASKALIGGTNATLWMYDAERIISEVEADLESCPDTRGIFLTSAGVLPPVADFEKSKKVVDAFKSLRP